MRLKLRIEFLKRQPGIDGDAAIKHIELAAAAQPAERQNYLATGSVGRTGAYETCVGALRQDMYALRGA